MKKYVTKIATGILTTGLVLGMTGINSVALHAAETSEVTSVEEVTTAEKKEVNYYIRRPGTSRPEGDQTDDSKNYSSAISGTVDAETYNQLVNDSEARDNSKKVATSKSDVMTQLLKDNMPQNIDIEIEKYTNGKTVEVYGFTVNWYRLNYGDHIDGEIVYTTVGENGEQKQQVYEGGEITKWVKDGHVYEKVEGQIIDRTQEELDKKNENGSVNTGDVIEEPVRPIRPIISNDIENEVEEPTINIEDEETPMAETPSEENSSDENVDDFEDEDSSVIEDENQDEEIVDIEDEEVAKSDAPIQKKQSVKETKEIEDMEVALSENPLTGDETPWGWMILAVTSLAGLVGLKFFRK